MKKVLLIFFLTQVAVTGYCQKADTFQVHFDLDNTTLPKRATDFIDRLIFKDILVHGQKLIVLGYTDYLGSSAHNDSLSLTRARNVKNYLVDAGFDPRDITMCAGRGKIERGLSDKKGYARDRKVQIIIDQGPHRADAAVMDIAHAKVNQAVKLNNILFVGGRPEILPVSETELQKLLKVLTDNKRLTIQIEGHVCCMGPTEGVDDNFLSVYRARAVYDYLISNGIAKDRLKYAGLGNINPVVNPEVTEEDRAMNRRVEIRILSK